MRFFSVHNFWQDQIYFHLFIALLHVDANEFSDCLNIYNSIITSTCFYLNEHICVISLIEISKKLLHETEAYFSCSRLQFKKTLGMFASYSACLFFCSLSLSLSILDDIGTYIYVSSTFEQWKTLPVHLPGYLRCPAFMPVKIKNYNRYTQRWASHFSSYLEKVL